MSPTWGVRIVSDFEITCCNKTYSAIRYSVKPYREGCIKENYRKCYCTECKQDIVYYERKYKQKNRKDSGRLRGERARVYEIGLDKKEIVNHKVQKGSKTASQWFHSFKGIKYDHNGKSYGRVFNPIQELIAV